MTWIEANNRCFLHGKIKRFDLQLMYDGAEDKNMTQHLMHWCVRLASFLKRFFFILQITDVYTCSFSSHLSFIIYESM